MSPKHTFRGIIDAFRNTEPNIATRIPIVASPFPATTSESVYKHIERNTNYIYFPVCIFVLKVKRKEASVLASYFNRRLYFDQTYIYFDEGRLDGNYLRVAFSDMKMVGANRVGFIFHHAPDDAYYIVSIEN